MVEIDFFFIFPLLFVLLQISFRFFSPSTALYCFYFTVHRHCGTPRAYHMCVGGGMAPFVRPFLQRLAYPYKSHFSSIAVYLPLLAFMSVWLAPLTQAHTYTDRCACDFFLACVYALCCMPPCIVSSWCCSFCLSAFLPYCSLSLNSTLLFCPSVYCIFVASQSTVFTIYTQWPTYFVKP